MDPSRVNPQPSKAEEVDEHDDRPLELPISTRPTFSRHAKFRGQEAASTSNEWQKPRDPRFDPRINGSNDVARFAKNYSFIDDLRSQELKELERALRAEKDPERKAKIKQTIHRTRNKMVERDNKSKKLELIGQMRQAKGQAGEGGKFRNVKKSEIKKTLLVNKYKELKESGKLTKYLERKRKKLINRDGKSFAP